jgi:hypothetical protein
MINTARPRVLWGPGLSDAAGEARARAADREGDVMAGQQKVKENFSKFDENFYKTREKAYIDYATPSLAREYGKAASENMFDLARRGILKSSMAVGRATSLDEELNKQRQAVAGEANNQANALRTQIENSRSNLMTQASAVANPVTMGVEALRTANTVSAPSAFAPVVGMFDNWMNNTLSNSLISTYRQAMGQQPGQGGARTDWMPGTSRTTKP